MIEEPPIKIKPRFKKLCVEYLKDHNATQAAIRAGYAPGGARQSGSLILLRPDVKAYLQYLLKLQDQENLVTVARTLQELAAIAYHDPASYFKTDDDGNEIPKKLFELSPQQRAAISEYNPKENTIKTYNKDPSLDKIGKYLKMYTEVHEQQHTLTIMNPIKVNGEELVFNVGQPFNPKK